MRGNSTPATPTTGREVKKLSKDTTVIKNLGPHHHRILFGIPTLGTVRMEWAIARRGLIIPVNYQSGELTYNHLPESVVSIGYSTADAQNTIVERAILDKYEWCLLFEDDTIPPFDALLRLNQYMVKGDIPIISGLYFTKGNPSWPLVFRGRGNGVFTNFEIGDLVWADGVPTGFLLIHGSILKWLWDNSPDYYLPDGKKIRQVFKFPRDTWYDPEKDRYFSNMGTSDLYVCDRIMKEKVFEKTGWTKIAKKKYPFLVDTNIFCAHIDTYGVQFPQGAQEVLWPKRVKPKK